MNPCTQEGGQPYPVFPKWALEHTPSREAGVSENAENAIRVKACSFIDEFGSSKLRFPRVTCGTAAVFFHRFYARHAHTLEQNDTRENALACLFLAGKAMGTVVKMRNFCNLYYEYKAETGGTGMIAAGVTLESKEARRFWDMIARRETTIMEAIEFNLWVEHPYRYLFALLRHKVLPIMGAEMCKAIARDGYDLVKGSFLTNLCISYSPQEIAVGVAHMLSGEYDFKIPQASPHVDWFAELCPEMKRKDISRISGSILQASNSQTRTKVKKNKASTRIHSVPKSDPHSRQRHHQANTPTLKNHHKSYFTHTSNPANSNPNHNQTPQMRARNRKRHKSNYSTRAPESAPAPAPFASSSTLIPNPTPTRKPRSPLSKPSLAKSQIEDKAVFPDHSVLGVASTSQLRPITVAKRRISIVSKRHKMANIELEENRRLQPRQVEVGGVHAHRSRPRPRPRPRPPPPTPALLNSCVWGRGQGVRQEYRRDDPRDHSRASL